MPSNALRNLENRLKDITQLMDAHKAITQFSAAKSITKRKGGVTLVSAVTALQALVADPGRGRRREVDAINRAAFVLLCSHFQGFIDDLHEETAQVVLDGRVRDIDAVVKLVRPGNANPHVHIIEKMFSGLGVYDLMQGISWQRCSSKTVQERLRTYIEERNKIAHGSQIDITKAKVVQFKKYVETLAGKLDEAVAQKAKETTGKRPW